MTDEEFNLLMDMQWALNKRKESETETTTARRMKRGD